jgi:Flp pilus assembly protein TadG
VRGAATVELAVLLPFLCFLFVAAVDSARVLYDGITVQNCAAPSFGAA